MKLTNEQWKTVSDDIEVAVRLLKSAAKDLKEDEKPISLIISKFLNVRMVESRRKAYAKFFKRVAKALDSLDKGNFDYILLSNNDKYVAEVDPKDTSHQVTLTQYYFSLPEKGKDSRFGTLIHEATHWNDVRGTDDHAYGEEIKTLSSVLGRNNADTWERILEKYGDLMEVG